jgi:hypothetical protein
MAKRDELSSDRPTPAQPSASQGKRSYRRTLQRTSAFWLMAGVFCMLFVATAAPAPLYRVYQAQWRFSATTRRDTSPEQLEQFTARLTGQETDGPPQRRRGRPVHDPRDDHVAGTHSARHVVARYARSLAAGQVV